MIMSLPIHEDDFFCNLALCIYLFSVRVCLSVCISFEFSSKSMSSKNKKLSFLSKLDNWMSYLVLNIQ